MNSWLNNVVASVDSAMAASSRSPATVPKDKKRAKGDTVEALSTDGDTAPATQQWVKVGVSAALTAMGEAVDVRLQATEVKR